MFSVPVIIIIVTGITGAAVMKASNKSEPAKLSPRMQYAFNKLLDSKLPAEKYRKAAQLFEDAGLRAEADLLKKRAALAALPKEEKVKMASAFGAAMKSHKPQGIRQVAKVFEKRGGVGAAATLRQHAADVEAANAVKPVPKMVQPPKHAAPPPAPPGPDAHSATADATSGTPTPPTPADVAMPPVSDAASGPQGASPVPDMPEVPIDDMSDNEGGYVNDDPNESDEADADGYDEG